MTMHTIPTTAARQIVMLALSELSLSPLNPRQTVDAGEIEALAQSIRVCGLIQNLSAIATTNGAAEIVAGGRRLRALKLLAETGEAPALIPVLLTDSLEEARLWASAENTARKDLAPADEVNAYGLMNAAGATLAAIASAFAVTEAHVRRRLKLASLPAEILVALKEGQISLGQAALFTLCGDEARQIEALESIKTREVNEHTLRQILQAGSVRSTDRRVQFVTLETYEKAGGTVTRDLFSTEVFVEDEPLLAELFTEKLAFDATLRRATGWKWIAVHHETYLPYDLTRKFRQIYAERGLLSEDEADEHEFLCAEESLDDEAQTRCDSLEAKQRGDFSAEQRAHSGGFIYVNSRGEVKADLGYIKPEDHQEAANAGIIPAAESGAVKSADKQKSPYSASLADDLRAMRLAAVQGALLAKPELVLDLLGFALSAASGHFATALDLRAGTPNIQPSKEDGVEIDARLSRSTDFAICHDLEAAFVQFQAEGKKARNAAITESIARSLNYGCSNTTRADPLFDHIEAEAGANIRTVWTPTAANFFGRVSGGYLDTLLQNLLGVEVADPRIIAFAKHKKAEKAAIMERLFSDAATQKIYAMTADQIAALATWTPEGVF